MIHDAEVVNDLDQIRSRYHLLRQLGRDGPFPVYAVRAKDSDRHFLLKVIGESGSQRTRAGALQPWQAHTVKALDHPKLMVMHAVHYLQGGAVAVAMDRRRGRTLAELLDDGGRLSVSRVEHILRDIGEALEYLHNRGVVHRGVRPHSIFLDYDRGHARLAFFGVDRGLGRQERDGETAPLVRAYTYLAPEQISGLDRVDGRALSPRSDLFSLGLVGFAMLTGRPPWQGAGLEDLLRARKREPLGALAELMPDSPEYLREVIARCLEHNPRRRCNTAREFVAQLEPADQYSSKPRGPDLASVRLRIQAGVRSVPTLFASRIDGATTRKVGMVTAAATMGLLAYGALRATDDPVARAEADLPFQTTTVLELPAPERSAEPERIPDGAAPAGAASSSRHVQSPGSADTVAPPRPVAPPQPPGTRSLPPSSTRQNLASSNRIVLLGEPLSRSPTGILGEPLLPGAGPR